jgi:hypothetical protein
MGNNASNGPINLDAIMSELDQLSTATAPTLVNRRIEKSPTSGSPYKVVVPVGEQHDDIIKNLRVPDANFRSVILTVGTQVFNGQLNSGAWNFSDAIPLFKIPHETCQLTIYSIGDQTAIPIELTYDSYCDVPVEIKTRCTGQALSSGALMYKNGYVF